MSDPTLRDAIEAAVDVAPESESAASTPEAPSPVEAAPTPAASTEPAAAGRARDEQGRFSKLADEPASKPATVEPVKAPQEAAQGIQPGPKAEPRPSPEDRAPGSWRPEVREHWSQLPPAVKAEVARREVEVQRALAESTQARQLTEQLQRTIAPYDMLIRAEGSNPLQAIDNLMSTAARLRTGTAPELAGLMAGMIKQFGVGRFGNAFVEQLDSALAGEVPRVDPVQSQVQQALQQQLAPVQQFMSQFQQAQLAQQQRLQQDAVTEVQQFLQAAEFGEDVREEMADLLEIAQRRGRDLSLQDAYRQACLANPRVRSALQARAQQRGGQAQTSAAQQAKAKASSITGGPAIATPRVESDSVRSAIESAIAANSR